MSQSTKRSLYWIVAIGLILAGICYPGCRYDANTVADFTIVCPSCSTFGSRKETIIHCRAGAIEAT